MTREGTGKGAGRGRFLLGAGLTLGAVFLAVAALVVGIRLLYAGEALPGTEVAGIAMGGASEAEIRNRLKPIAESDEPITVHAEDQQVPVRPGEAGYTMDLEASVEKTLAAGRDGALGGAFSTLGGLLSTRRVPLVARIDAAKFQRTVAAVADQIDRPSFAGRLDIVASTGDVGVDPPRAGRRVNRRVLRAELREALRDQTTRRIEVPVARRAVASRADVEAVAQAATDYLRKPLVLTGAGRPLVISVEQLAAVLALEPLEDGRDARLGVDADELTALVGHVAEERDRPARDASLTAPLRPVVLDGKGDLSWKPRPAKVEIRGSRPGREVDSEELADSIENAVRAGEHRVKVPVRRVRPEITTRDARGVDSLIGTFTTYYPPGEPRVTNIRRIAEVVDGTDLAPGEQFSLNGVAGRRTRSKGYVPAPFIADGKIVPSVGGGVSQFSTTLYNAAYFAGLQVDSHQSHSLFIDRYPAGREATLNYPDIDLTWTNNTEAPILVRASGDDTSVSVSLYGDNGGRRVSARTGPREPFPGGDFTILVTRSVRFPDGHTEEDTFRTNYDLPAE